jgi:hypothetical protein
MKLTNTALTIFLLVTGIFAQEMAVTGSPEGAAAVNITSTLAGGLWSSPATWVGGAVPQANDSVTIASGATVIIDTAAVAGSITVGSTGSLAETKFYAPLGGSPAVLRFGETAAFSLTVAQDVTIGSNDVFSTGSGSETSHILTVGGNLTNNGTLDFSTNNDLAGAGIVFTGAANNTFGGTGAVNDIRTIKINKGIGSANTLELAVSNFTVQGTTTDGPASAYLTLNTGTFKVSGAFPGTHRTFSGAAAYGIPGGAGFWLNNPNYTVAAQGDTALIAGSLRVSAGTYNVGTQAGNSLLFAISGSVRLDGGSINVTGRFGIDNTTLSVSYIQNGGTLTTCTIGHSSVTFACFDLGTSGSPITMLGGDIVIRNHTPGTRDYRMEAGAGPDALTGTTVRFGNSLTNGASTFSAVGWLPNIALDTSAGGHTLTLLPEQTVSRTSNSLNIGPGGTFDIGNGGFYMRGNNVVNDGTIKADHPGSLFLFGRGPGSNPVYSGSGVWSGIATRIDAWCDSLAFDPAVDNIRVRYLHVQRGNVINAYKLTLGNNDNIASKIAFGVIFSIGPSGTLDSAPVFELGTGGQILDYGGTSVGAGRDMGPELNPSRTLAALFYQHGGPLTITGGDLTVNQLLLGGIISTGGNRLILNGSMTRTFGYIAGPFKRRIDQTGTWDFPVGTSGISGAPVTVAVSALGTSPSYLTVTSAADTMPGLVPATSIARYWRVVEEGDITATMTFQYLAEDIRGAEPNYKLWSNAGNALAIVSGHILNTIDHYSRTPAGITNFTGNWGIGEQSESAPVSISGTVTAFGGQPIANALLTLSGGNLPSPIQVQTGSFGIYQFSNLQAGSTYTVRVDVKRFRFSQNTQVMTPAGNVSNVNFTAGQRD